MQYIIILVIYNGHEEGKCRQTLDSCGSKIIDDQDTHTGSTVFGNYYCVKAE
jgi:hypothetical protein